MKKIVKIASIILISVFIVAQTNSQAHADEIVNIAGFTELAKCYKKNIIKPEISTVSDKFKVKDIFKKEDSETFAAVPNMYQNTVADYNVSCEQLVNGYDPLIGGEKYDALINNNKDELGETAAKEFLEKMGYTSNGNGGKYVNFTYKKTDWLQKQSEVHTHKIKVTDIKNGKITNSSIIEIEKSGIADLVKFDVYNKTTLQIYCNPTNVPSQRGGCGDITISSGTSFESFAQEVYNQLATHRQTYTKDLGGYMSKTEKYVLLKYDPSNNIQNGANQGDDGKWVFIGKSEAKAADAAVKNNSNFDSVSSLVFTAEQKTTLHQFYFNEFYRAKLICNGDEGYDSLPAGAIEAIKSGDKTCYAIAMAHVGSDSPQDKVHAITPKLTWYVDYTFEQLVKNMTEDELLGAQTAANSTDSGKNSEEDRDPDCFTNAGALGSIICPAIDGASKHVEQAYTNLVEPYLQIDALLFDASTTGGKAVQKIWGIFQGFANLAFVLIFLFVIFSQLTGVGIDNYGIKKILPKLIIGAVLINLSYIICQLAVDMSNILGIAIKGLINNAGEEVGSIVSNLNVNLNSGHAKSVPLKVPTGTLVVVGIASVLGVTQFLSAGMAILIPALVALVSIAVGVMFLFIMLALRQAIAVILVVVSPMAFAAYLLPNTKKLLFDKWVEAFKGMLIAYPICSALVYGGDLVSKILLASEGTGADGTTDITSLGIILSAAAVSIAPIFFIPSVIKKGMDGIAGLSTIMNKAQGTIGGNATKQANARLNNSRLTDYQNRRSQEQSNRANARRDEKKFKAAGKRMGKLQRKIDQSGLGGLSTSERAAYQDATSTINSRNKQMTDLYSQTFSTLGVGALTAELTKMGASGEMDANLMQAAINRIGEIDQGEAVKSMSTLSKTAAFKNMNEKDKNRIIQTCLSQKGNPLLKAYAKALGRPDSKVSFTDFANDASTDGLQHTLINMGDNVFADMDKDVMDVIANSKGELGTNTEISKMFSNEQMAAGYGQGFSGSTGDKFNAIIKKRDNSQTKDDLKAISTKQLASVKRSALEASEHGGAVDVNAALAEQVDDMKKDDNTELRSSMDNEARGYLGLGNSSTTP